MSALAMEKQLYLPYPVLSRWLERDPLFAGAFGILAILGSSELYAGAKKGLAHLQRVVRIAEGLKIEQPSDNIPADKLTTFLFNVLFSPDGRLVQDAIREDGGVMTEAEVGAVLCGVIRGDGIDIPATKAILNTANPDWFQEYAVEVDRGLSILNK
eukprot:2466303-Rhodomonas_salina.1